MEEEIGGEEEIIEEPGEESFKVPPPETLENLSVSEAKISKEEDLIDGREEKGIAPKNEKFYPAFLHSGEDKILAEKNSREMLPEPQREDVNLPFPQETFQTTSFQSSSESLTKDFSSENKKPPFLQSETKVEALPIESQSKKQPLVSSTATTPSYKSSKIKIVFLVLVVVLVLIIFSFGGVLYLEWFGGYSFGLLKYLGPPPPQFIWSKIKFPKEAFSFRFSGEVKLNSEGQFYQFLERNNFKDLKAATFIGEAQRVGDELTGVFTWEKGRPIYFKLSNDSLLVTSDLGKEWYKIRLGNLNIGSILNSFNSIFENPGDFVRVASGEGGNFWYGCSLIEVLQLNNFKEYIEIDSAGLKMGVNPKTKSLSQLLFNFSASDATLILGFKDIANQNLSNAPELEVPQVKELGENTPFGLLSSFLKEISKKTFGVSTAKEAANVVSDVSQRDKKRKEDLEKLKALINRYYEDKGKYPLSKGRVKIEEAESTLGKELEPYLGENEKWDFGDPLYPDFWYFYISDGENYALSARLENENDPEVVMAGGKPIYFVLSNPFYNPLR